MNHTPIGNILVTGAASGLGAAVMQAVAQAGGQPWGLDRVASSDMWPYELADVSDREATQVAIGRLRAEARGFDGVVTCAGVDACGPLADVPAEAWENVIGVNLVGTATVIRELLPELLERRGHVVTVASTLGLRALPAATAYCASKFGVVGFTRALAAETQGELATTLIITGGMQTNFFVGRPPEYQPGPDAVLNSPDRVAEAVVFALSQAPGSQVREVVVTPDMETSWP